MKKGPLITIFACGLALVGSATIYFWQSQKDLLTESSFGEKAEPTFGPAALEWRLLAWRDENGDIPDGGLANALAERDAYLQANLDGDGFGEMPVSPLKWVSRGPENVGGRTRSVVVHPTVSGTLWAGSVGGGVWKSENGGDNWLPTNGQLANFVVTSLVMDPSDPIHNTLYAATGEEGYNAQSGVPGGGIFRSTNGGTQWRRVPGTDPAQQGNAKFSSISKVARDAARIVPPGINANVPKINAPTAEWFATGIPQERFARKTFKPGTIPGILDPDRIRKMLGQPPLRAN